jgi:S-adenosylmethionine/arginine decarboxylase-like enzyme
MKGRHIIRDYSWEVNHLNNIELSNYIFNTLETLIYISPLKIVAKQLTILPLLPHKSEVGSTGFFSLDSSHCAFHLYYESKLVAVELFGCGSADLEYMMNCFETKLLNLPNGFKKTYGIELDRFHE